MSDATAALFKEAQQVLDQLSRQGQLCQPGQGKGSLQALSPDAGRAVRAIIGRISHDDQDQAQDSLRLHLGAGLYEEAASTAGILMLCNPRHSYRSFLFATCLQRLGEQAAAALMYAQSLLGNAPFAVAAYRLGECLLSLGETGNADDAFEWAMALSNDEDDGHIVRDMVQAARAATRRCHG